MTPQVIEVRLKRQRPDLLKLFAQPELADCARLAPDQPAAARSIIVIATNPLLLRPTIDPSPRGPR